MYLQVPLLSRLLGRLVRASSSLLPALRMYRRLSFHSLPISVSCYFQAVNIKQLVQAMNRGRLLQETSYMMAGRMAWRWQQDWDLDLGHLGYSPPWNWSKEIQRAAKSTYGSRFHLLSFSKSTFLSGLVCCSWARRDFLLFIVFYPAASLRSK